MTSEMIINILQGIGQLFINPLLYIALIFAVFLGYRRVKREREFFHIRILNGWSELKVSIVAGVGMSIILSMITAVIGVALEPQFLFICTVVTMVVLISFVYHLLSPVVLFALSMMILVLIEQQNYSFQVVSLDIVGVEPSALVATSVCMMAGILVIAESILIRRFGEEFASPVIEQTKRGMHAVSYLSKQVWVLPMFVLIPGNLMPAFIPYWPQFTLGETSFSFIVFPFVIGFQQLTRKTLPVYFYPKLAKSVFIVGIMLVIGSVVGYFITHVALIVLGVGALWRLAIALYYKRQERNDVYAVAATSMGVMIAGVLPNSPAEKMGLLAGEVIKRVNGREVHDETGLYEALQVNAAHCKLEVLNHNKEIRLTQHVVHSDDHYRIGILLAK